MNQRMTLSMLLRAKSKGGHMPIWLQWTFTTMALLSGVLPLFNLDKPERPMSARGRAICSAVSLVLAVIALVYLIGGGK